MRFTDVQLRGGCTTIQTTRDFPPEAVLDSSGAGCPSTVRAVNLSYSPASYVATEESATQRRSSSSGGRFRTPWQEVGRIAVQKWHLNWPMGTRSVDDVLHGRPSTSFGPPDDRFILGIGLFNLIKLAINAFKSCSQLCDFSP